MTAPRTAESNGKMAYFPTRPESVAAEVFRRYGLQAPGFLERFAVPSRVAGTSARNNLRLAFEELGGVYLAFAEFLLWRADVLAIDHLNALRGIKTTYPPVPREEVAALLRRELGGNGDALAHEMELEPVWSTVSRTAYRSQYDGMFVVIQVARPPFPEAELAQFEAGIRHLGNAEVAVASDARTITEFRQWLKQAESCATERAYLEVLGRAKDQTLVAYPALITNLTTDRVLCWPWVDGEPLSSRVGKGSTEAVTQAAVAVLEQYCTLSLVDTELDWDAMIFPEGATHLTYRRFSRPVAVPDTSVNAGLKYIAAVLEGHITVTAQTLVRLSRGKSTSTLEARLLGFMSGIDPELKVGIWFPDSAATFEINWRALAALGGERPLFVNCLHRNLVAAGYWTAEAVAAGAAPVDTIADAHWPVVKRLVSLNSSRLTQPLVITEWAVGLGLLGFGAMREANRLAEEVRDNNVTFEVDTAKGRKRASDISDSSTGRNALIGCLLVALLVVLRWGVTFSEGSQAALVPVALVLLLALVRLVAKIR